MSAYRLLVTISLARILFCCTPATATIIRPAGVLFEEYVFNSAAQVVDNSGLSATLNTGASLSDALAATHLFNTGWQQSYSSTDPGGTTNDFFASIGSDTDVDLLLDLSGGGDLNFRSVVLWQYQNNGGGGSRVGNDLRTLEIRINTEAQGTNAFSSLPAATLTLKPLVDGDADASNDLGGTNSAQAFDIGTQSGRYVLLSLTDNYYGLQGMTAGGDRVGLGEIRFATDEISVPEPAVHTLVLLASATFFFLGRRLDYPRSGVSPKRRNGRSLNTDNAPA